jgi:hypothetical protein
MDKLAREIYVELSPRTLFPAAGTQQLGDFFALIQAEGGSWRFFVARSWMP